MRQPEFELTAVSLEGLPAAGLPEIAMAGRSNVGKSSLINMLARRRNLARTSRTPGKTQAINFYRFGQVRVVDLPGYGFARAPRGAREAWSRLVDSYLSTREVLAGVILLVDARHRAFPDDLDMLDWVRRRRLPLLVAATKSDKLKRGALASSLAALREDLAVGPERDPASEIVAFSSVDGRGRQEVLTFLERIAR